LILPLLLPYEVLKTLHITTSGTPLVVKISSFLLLPDILLKMKKPKNPKLSNCFIIFLYGENPSTNYQNYPPVIDLKSLRRK